MDGDRWKTSDSSWFDVEAKKQEVYFLNMMHVEETEKEEMEEAPLGLLDEKEGEDGCEGEKEKGVGYGRRGVRTLDGEVRVE
jgi:hypothetical protein